MKLFDHTNPRHLQILKEELQYVKQLIELNSGQMANMYMRGTFSIIYRDDEYKNTNEMQDFVAGVVNASSTDKDDILNALRDYSKTNPEKMQDLNIQISKMAEPIHPRISSTNSSLTADTYAAWQGRGGWQGDQLWNQGVTRFTYVIDTDKKTGESIPRFLNIACIQQIYQKDEDIIIEMTDYSEVRVINTNIHVFMDRFVQFDIYNKLKEKGFYDITRII